MIRKIVVALLILAASGQVVPVVRAEITAEQVSKSIDAAIVYLKGRQRANGTWPDFIQNPGGMTALATLALLEAGVDPDDDAVQKALAALRLRKPDRTYFVSLQTMVFCAAEPRRDLNLIQRNVRWLEERQATSGPMIGGWGYQRGRGDNSNSQFALLALYEAERVGVPVRPRVWRMAYEHWSASPNADGSWGYMPGGEGTGSMTCAGIASTIIAAGQWNAGDAVIEGDRVQCCGRQQSTDAVENGLAWLARNFSVQRNPGVPQEGMWHYYYLYALERAGRMTARRFIGQHDWYREGAELLVREQDTLEGRWKGAPHAEDDPLVATSLALLFLSKGRRPVLVGKLKHGSDDDWQRHRGDIANLTRHVEQRWDKKLTWQVIDPVHASVEDLLQAPVLFLNGQNAPTFTEQEKKHLREYVNQGGFIFAEACCDGADFENGFRQLMRDVFPDNEQGLMLLPPEHPIWRAEQPVPPDAVRRLEGINVGCRTSVVFCPQDLSCYWELARAGRRKAFPAPVKKQVDAALAIGANVMAYATNRELKYKYERFETAEPAEKDPFARGKLRVASLKHAGGCNAAPAAVVNLMKLARRGSKLRVSTENRSVALTDPELFEYHLIFMHGRNDFSFSPKERDQLREYVDHGGMLFIDAVCSSDAFATAVRRELKRVFPSIPLARIPRDDALLSDQFGGQQVTRVDRRVVRHSGGGTLRSGVRKTDPYLESIKLGDRHAVVFSRFDISCALENQESLECEGYTRESAARLALNVLLYSLHQ